MQELRGMPVVKQIAADAALQVEELKKKGIEPKLAVVRVGEREDDLSYERGLLKRFDAVGALVESVVFPVDVTQEELEGMLVENADEPYAAEIAATVMKWFKNGKTIETTSQMKQVIEQALVYVPKAERDEAIKKSCARTFQALRIDVNSEFEVLYAFLEKLPEVLAPNGRVAILTFHSGEDRLVKLSFKELKKFSLIIFYHIF